MMSLIVILRRRAFVVAGILSMAALFMLLAVWRFTPRPVHPFLMRSPARPLIIAHRGASGAAPENTLPAFRLALAEGADVLEMDAHQTRDGEWVVIHDPTVDRTTNGQGLVGETMLDELKSWDAGHTFTADGGRTYPYRGQGVSVPTLEEVFQAFPGVRMVVEIKELRPGQAEDLARMIRKWQRMDQVSLVAADARIQERLRAALPEMARIADAGEVKRFFLLHQLGLSLFFKPAFDAFQVPLRIGQTELVTEEFLADAHRAGLAVHVWTVDDPAQMRRLVEMGVDGIITNYPGRLNEVLESLEL